MAQIASIFLSTANSSPSSEAAQSQSYPPYSLESDFPRMLSQASFSASERANGVNSASAANLFSGKIRSLLEKGVSLDRISNAIATKLVALADGKSGSGDKDTSAKVAAVAAYLEQGEGGAHDLRSTANDLVKKVVALLSALRQQNGSTAANVAVSNSDSRMLLQAPQAGDTPSTKAPTQQPDTSRPAASAPGTLLSALAALLPPAREGMTALASPLSPEASLAELAQSFAPSTAALPPTPSTAALPATTAARADANNANASTSVGSKGEPRVDSGLQAIAAGEGTALERALIRAAGASVAREATLVGSQSDSELTVLSASLDQLLAAFTAPGGTGLNPRGIGGAAAVQSADSMPSPTVVFGVNGGEVAQGSVASSATSAPTATQSSLPLEEIIDQVVSGLSMKNFHANPTVSIALNPPDLGRLSVKISVADFHVTANVLAPSTEVQNALLAHRSQLDQLFASAGLKLGTLNVDVSGQGLGEEVPSRQAQRESLLAASRDASKQGTGPSMLGSITLNLLNQLV